MQRRKDDNDIKEAAEKLITFSYRTLYVVLLTVSATVAAASAGYISINSTANEALYLAGKHEAILNHRACDVRQLKNFMIYSVRPHANDSCTKEATR